MRKVAGLWLALLPSLAAVVQARSKALTGRFLHITDIHPDPYYKTNASVQASCHHFKPEDDSERAPRLGRAVSECDSPLALVNHTFAWLEKNWVDEVDFVVWTGDNARHDIDSAYPRSLNEIYKLNIDISDRMFDLFESRGIPVIPSLGNNDIYPHNNIEGGPNRITNEYAKLWAEFIPPEDFHTVARGLYFAREVVPGLMVVSLNTMYYFDNNKIVDGCPPTKPGQAPDPGTLQLDWLTVQLDRWRDQGKQVWLTGHVPPTENNWWPGCFDRYKEIVISFQDTIVGQIFGHVNVDHFAYLDYKTLGKAQVRSQGGSKERHMQPWGGRVSIAKFLHQDLLSTYEGLPRKSKMKLQDYMIIHTVPSVIPTFLPGIRIWNYNVSNPQDAYVPQSNVMQSTSLNAEDLGSQLWRTGSAAFQSVMGFTNSAKDAAVHMMKKKRKKHRKKKKPAPRLPRYFSADSPSRRNRYLSPLGYTQYYLPIDKHDNPDWLIEYTSYASSKSHLYLPTPMQPNSSTTALHASYGLDDLTIPSWLAMAKELTKSKSLWKSYVNRMYVSSDAERKAK